MDVRSIERKRGQDRGFQFQFPISAFRAFPRAAAMPKSSARVRARGRMHRARVCDATAVKLRGPIFVAGSVRKDAPRYTLPLRRQILGETSHVFLRVPTSPGEKGRMVRAAIIQRTARLPARVHGFGLISRNDWPEYRKIASRCRWRDG